MKNSASLRSKLFLLLIVNFILLSCTETGGSSDGSNNQEKYTISGNLSGLTAGAWELKLSLNTAEQITLTSSGDFSFTTKFDSLENYLVEIVSLDTALDITCNLTNGSGSIAGANVFQVKVVCKQAFTIGGTVNGMTGTDIIIQNNGGENLTVSGNESFTFPNTLFNGETFNITILQHSTAQTCFVENESGIIANEIVSNISIVCTDQTSPTISFTPLAVPLGTTTPIVFQFNKSMNTNTLNLNGSFANFSHTKSWSTRSIFNDTLTLTPTTAWQSSGESSLTLSISDFFDVSVQENPYGTLYFAAIPASPNLRVITIL